MQDQDYFDAFLKGYAECAEWCGVIGDEGEGETVDARGLPMSSAAWRSLVTDAIDFFDANRGDLDLAASTADYNWELAGHDFWLSRNGHGAGYFDRDGHGAGYFDRGDDVFQRLQAAARIYGEQTLAIGRWNGATGQRYIDAL